MTARDGLCNPVGLQLGCIEDRRATAAAPVRHTPSDLRQPGSCPRSLAMSRRRRRRRCVQLTNSHRWPSELTSWWSAELPTVRDAKPDTTSRTARARSRSGTTWPAPSPSAFWDTLHSSPRARAGGRQEVGGSVCLGAQRGADGVNVVPWWGVGGCAERDERGFHVLTTLPSMSTTTDPSGSVRCWKPLGGRERHDPFDCAQRLKIADIRLHALDGCDLIEQRGGPLGRVG